MKKDLQIISKGLYKQSADNDLIVVPKQYIFGRTNGKKCLLLRFENTSNQRVDAISFCLVQLNSDGVELSQKKIELSGLHCAPKEIFAPGRYFFVDEKCTNFEIRMISVTSDNYEYFSKNGEGYIRYPLEAHWEYLSKKNQAYFNFSKLEKNKIKFSKAILILALILIALAIIWPFFIKDFCPMVAEAWDNFWKMVARDTKELFERIGESFSKKNI